MTIRFSNKTVLITGAGTGMGEAVAHRLANEGAQLILIGRREAPLNALAATLKEQGTSAYVLPCDIANEQALNSAMQEIQQTFDQLDGLFANAGILEDFGPVADTPTQRFEALFNVNLKGTFLSIKQALPLLVGGSIVINASWTASGVMPGAGAYAATKGGLLSLMRNLAVEEGVKGTRVNAVSPGIILTPMADEVLDPALSQKLADHTPLKRNGTPDDVSGTVAWLLSDDSRFVTGQDIAIDGGYTLGGVRL